MCLQWPTSLITIFQSKFHSLSFYDVKTGITLYNFFLCFMKNLCSSWSTDKKQKSLAFVHFKSGAWIQQKYKAPSSLHFNSAPMKLNKNEMEFHGKVRCTKYTHIPLYTSTHIFTHKLSLESIVSSMNCQLEYGSFQTTLIGLYASDACAHFE